MGMILQTNIDKDGVMTVFFNHPDRSANTLNQQMFDELEDCVSLLERGSHNVSAVIFTSDKLDVFIIGADLFEMNDMDRDQMQHFLERGQKLFDRIENLKMPTVAAINGHCLGGGLELAMACRWRVASDKGTINIGLPESKLGIFPAWGGTTRLTRRLGAAKALPILLTGRLMPPAKAQRAGLVDEVVRPEALIHAARRLCNRQRSKGESRRVAFSLWTLFVCWAARRKTLAKTLGHYPAAEKLIDVVRIASLKGHEAGLRAERESVIELVDTEVCRNLMRLFYLQQEAKQSIRKTIGVERKTVEHAVVIGGGTMGAGIAHALVRTGVKVGLIDINEDVISSALGRIKAMLDADVRSKRLSMLQAQQAMCHISPFTDWNGLKLADIVIEAVAETMDVKGPLFKKLDQFARPDTVLASNTSSLSITDLAEVTKIPSRVIGLHFFNPVPKMPLVEVIRTKYNNNKLGNISLASAAALSLSLGKTPIVVADAPGFLVNRVLIPYLAEALVMASQGVPVTDIDTAMKRWGMPMGPFELLDQIGLDVGVSILHSVRGRLGDHIMIPDSIGQVIDHGWLGRKTGQGFYDYRRKQRRSVNMGLVNLLTKNNLQIKHNALDDQSIQWRLMLPMINESARLLTEGVVDSADTIDLASVFGLGLAPFRGGLVRFAETMGLDRVVEAMMKLQTDHGLRFAPVESLCRIADAKKSMQELVCRNKTRTAHTTCGEVITS